MFATQTVTWIFLKSKLWPPSSTVLAHQIVCESSAMEKKQKDIPQVVIISWIPQICLIGCCKKSWKHPTNSYNIGEQKLPKKNQTLVSLPNCPHCSPTSPYHTPCQVSDKKGAFSVPGRGWGWSNGWCKRMAAWKLRSTQVASNPKTYPVTWNQPIWKILVKMGSSSPNRGEY